MKEWFEVEIIDDIDEEFKKLDQENKLYQGSGKYNFGDYQIYIQRKEN